MMKWKIGLLFMLALTIQTSLQATDVSGNVSGVWDLAGSPYMVMGEIRVATGQTLEIRPGVQVRFTGHFKLVVNGNLQAVGTEQDSIVFTRAYPTEASKWWGIRFTYANDSSVVSYCRIEYGKADAGGQDCNTTYDCGGGGIFCFVSSPTISHCLITRNEAYGGGGFHCDTGTPHVNDCVVTQNHATYGGGGVGCWHASPVFTRCVITNNICDLYGGGLGFGQATPTVNSCTFAANTPNNIQCDAPAISSCSITSSIIADANGHGIVFTGMPYQISYCDFYGNAGDFSNLPQGPAGIGELVTVNANGDSCDQYHNILLNPMFMDTGNGNYHLQPTSPCINAGDPSLPLDLDGSVADIGAFTAASPHNIYLLSPNGGEAWRVFQNDTVMWSSAGFEGVVLIELNRNYPSGTWELLKDSTANDGVEAVYVTDPLSTHCRVRISAIGDTLSDISDGDFSITASQGYLALVRTSAPSSPVLSWNAGSIECPQVGAESFRLKNFGSEAIVVFQPLEPLSSEFSRTTSCGTFLALAPGQMSACSLRLGFDPGSDGTFRDTLLVQTDAVNGVGGYVRIPLSGMQISTPAVPQIVIQPQGEDIHLAWQPITQSVGGCPVNVTRYLVFYAPTHAGPYYYHGYTSGTAYTHIGAVSYASGMFYQVVARTGETSIMEEIPGNGVLTMGEVMESLK